MFIYLEYVYLNIADCKFSNNFMEVYLIEKTCCPIQAINCFN